MSGGDRILPSLNVIRVIARLNVGGPARHVVLLNQGLDAKGHRTLLVHGSTAPYEASLEQTIRSSEIRSLKLQYLGPSLAILGDLFTLLALVRLIFREAPDVVHTHTAKAGVLGRLAALVFNATRPRNRRCLVVHTFHGHVLRGYFHPIVERLVRTVERSLARFTDWIVTISPSQRRDIVEQFRVAKAAQTIVIPLGLSLGPLLRLEAGAPNWRGELGFAVDAVVVGFVGRMVPIKDLASLAAAFGQAAAGCAALHLLLAGDGPERAELEAVFEANQLKDRVRFIGWTHDLPGLYATMDICALSSRNEGTPVAVIEAMAAAKPVVATAVGGVPDVVADGETGILVQAGDVPALARAMLRLASDADLRNRMGQAGRSRAAARYPHERLVDDMERLYVAGLAQAAGRRVSLAAPEEIAR